MKIRSFLALAVVPVAMLAPGSAAAQVADLRELDDVPFTLGDREMNARMLDDMEVYGLEGEQIGEVEEILVDSTGQVAALVVETEGFLGIGDEDVVLMLEQLRFENDRLTVDLTEEQLEALPEWEDD